MRVIIVTDTQKGGGAGIAASRLAEGLSDRGHELTIVTYKPSMNAGRVLTTITPEYSETIAYRALNRVFAPLVGDNWSTFCSRRWLRHTLSDLKPDAINVHNLHGASWPMSFLDDCAECAPTVCTLHDMWSITGRCVYAGDCRRYLSGCDSACPTANQYPALPPSQIAQEWKKKNAVLRRHEHLAAITPSHWLAEIVENGHWQNHRVETIPNGLPLDVYFPRDQADARAECHISGAGPVILVAAQNLNDERKGMHLLINALCYIKARPITLVTFGSGSLEGVPPDIRVVHLGLIHDEDVKAKIYSAADLYVHPALEDNLPNTVMESIACGTPVVCFPVGGLPEMVHNDCTGWLVPQICAEALGSTIDGVIATNGFKGLRTSCRVMAESHFSVELQARRYEELMTSMISKLNNNTPTAYSRQGEAL